MMTDEPPHDVESHFEEELNIPSFVKRKSWSKRIAITLGVIAALLLIIVVPIVVVKAGDESVPSAAIAVGSDGSSGDQRPTVDVTVGVPLDSVPTESPNDEQDVVDGNEEAASEESSQPAAPEETTYQATDSGASTSSPITVPPAFTDTICSALNISSELGARNWLQIADQIMGETLKDLSGTSIDLAADGSIVAIAASENDGNGVNAGHVRVYQYSSLGEFTLLGQELNGEAMGDRFGASVALDASGYRLAAGGLYNDGQSGSNSGQVRVFDYSQATDTWNQVGEDLEGPVENSQFGRSLSMSADGKRLAVGAWNCHDPINMTANFTDTGCVYLYDFVDDAWVRFLQIRSESEGDGFGESVKLSADGSHVAIGAYKHTAANGGADAGQVKIYRHDPATSNWMKVGNAIEGVPGSSAGMALSLSGDGSRVAVGFPGNNQGLPVPGFSRIYELIDGVWAQIGSTDLTGGFSVSLSRDGARVVVGDYNGMNNGILSGHVYVYRFNNTSQEWDVLGEEINGLPNEMSGLRVGISADGMRVALAAPRASSHNGTEEVGAVRLYDLC